MNTDPAIRETMIAAIPRLRRFAVSLAGVQHADDLVQETLLLAWDKIRLFDARADMLPWLITILRNRFYDQRRKRRKEIEDVDGGYAQALTTGPAQIAHVEHADLRTALLKLPKEMREALIAVGYSGLSYQEARRLAIALSAPSAAACIERANVWARFWASKVQPILPR